MEFVEVEFVDVEFVEVEFVEVEFVEVEFVEVEFVDSVKSVVNDGAISMNETCSCNIGTPPSFGQSVNVLM